MNTVNVSRRRLLQASAVTGGGLVVGFSFTGCSSAPAPLPVASTEALGPPMRFCKFSRQHNSLLHRPLGDGAGRHHRPRYLGR